MEKDAAYWKEYRAKNREKLNQQRMERYHGVAEPDQVQPVSDVEVPKTVTVEESHSIVQPVQPADELQPYHLPTDQWIEYAKDKCIFCFQPGKVFNRRYGKVVLCERHGI